MQIRALSQRYENASAERGVPNLDVEERENPLMKKLAKAIFSSLLLPVLTTTSSLSLAGPIPQGDTQVGTIENYTVHIGLQYRTMYNFSNIPLSGITNFRDTTNYDFFRQRMRFNVEVQPKGEEDVGGFMQIEYRGGWGGSSPESSDPRDAGLTLNAFNRLQSRGVRYGYVYYTPDEKKKYLAAGIIPISDELGDTLFSADWDFNVGGITYSGVQDYSDYRLDYRLAYARLIDGVSSSNRAVVGENASLLIADANYIGSSAHFGAHIYYLYAPQDIGTATPSLPGKVSQGWYALTGSMEIDSAELNGFVCLNMGDYGTTDNTGFALKAEAVIPVNDSILKFLAVYATGDKAGTTADNQFRTIQGIFGTEGYWAYTHLFTANDPSDVNDLGVGLDNSGQGLTSLQTKVEDPLTDKLTGEVSMGWFQASEENASGDKDMGIEIGGMGTYEMAKDLNLQVGFAYAFLGDYFKSGNQYPDNLYELYSRFQLQF